LLERQNALQYVFDWGFAPDPVGSTQRFPRPPSCIEKGKKESVRKKQKKGKETGAESRKGENVKGQQTS